VSEDVAGGNPVVIADIRSFRASLQATRVDVDD
jgi:hypothetical protein